jgi:hypothetical protein
VPIHPFYIGVGHLMREGAIASSQLDTPFHGLAQSLSHTTRVAGEGGQGVGAVDCHDKNHLVRCL